MRISDWSSDVCSSDLRDFDDALRMALQQVRQCLRLQVADIAGEAMVLLVGELVAGNRNLLGVDHDQIVAGVKMRGDRKSAVEGKRVSVRVDVGGRRFIINKKVTACV